METHGVELTNEETIDEQDGELVQHPQGSCPPVCIYGKFKIPVKKYSSWIVREIGRRVRLSDDFPFHLTWTVHRSMGRVDGLFNDMKHEYGLDDLCRGWFNEHAQKCWNTWKSKVLKKFYDHFKTHAEARLADPVHLGISKVNWLKLTDEFQRVNTVRHYKCGLTKKQQTMMARASQKAPTRMGSKSMHTYRAEYADKFKKPCNPTIVMDRVYGVADPVLGEERDPMSEEVIAIAQQRISTDLIEARGDK